MRPLWKDILTAFFLGIILPGLMVNGAVLFLGAQTPPAETIPRESEARTDSALSVKVRSPEGIITEMDMDSYITRVVLAEMPASFEPEALKAQSVAARTYARKAAVTGGKHDDGSVCMIPSCCQGYIIEEDYLAGGGTRDSVDKIRRAVEETSGLVLTYEGELIEATYFSCSGGVTEDAAAVWGTDYPYLQSVSSPGEEKAEPYTQTLEFTPEEFCAALDRDLPGDPRDWFTVTTYTEGGGVAVMTICGQTYSGTRLRALLGLRSTAFAVAVTQDRISITTKGYGHRVGLSQYGADAMAVSGCDFQQILAHYYPGTVLEQVKNDASA